MTRKSKQAGGHNPLTHYERTKKFRSSNYGTTSARLTTESQGNFGDCALGLTPATDPVVTKSGHIYNREAILEYLLTKTTELKEERANYERWVAQKQAKLEKDMADEHRRDVEDFEDSQKVVPGGRKRARRDDNDDDGGKDDGQSKKKSNGLKTTSYWLAEYQPEHEDKAPDPPPERPPSPHSSEPLRRKDLRSIVLERSNGKVQCCLSHKTISTQPVVALFGEGHVILEDLYDKLVKPTMICPFTSKKLKEKNVVRLVKGKSGFASSGPVKATTYRPTIT